MRIGIVTHKIGYNNGQGRVNYEIAVEALRQGHEVVLFCEYIDDDLVSRKNVWPELMPSPSWLPSRMLRDQLFALRAKRRIYLMQSARARPNVPRCDVMLANGFVSWTKAHVNAVHFVHSSWQHSPHHPWRKRRTVDTMYRHLYNRVNAVLERQAFGRSREIVAVSNKVRQELIQLGVPVSAITTIVNGVDAQEFHPGPADLARFGLPVGRTIGLFAGDLSDSRKNLDTVLRALVKVPDLHLAVAGRHEGTLWPRLSAKLGIADRVHFLGFQKDMPALMRVADFFVFPSRYEACSLVLLEALASGLPVVTARSAGGAELVSPDVGIVLDDSEDVESLEAALRSLVTSTSRRESMAIAARATALRHSWPQMAAQYVSVLEAAHRQERGFPPHGRVAITPSAELG